MKRYFFKFKGLLSVNIFMIALTAVANVYLAFILKSIVDIGTKGTVSELKTALVFSLCYVVATFAIGYTRKFLEALYIKKTLVSLKNDVFGKILGQNLKSFNEENSAKYISLITNDINIVEQDYFINILQIIYNAISFGIATFAIIKMNVYITIGVFVVGAVTIIIPMAFGKKLGKSKNIYSDSLGIFTTKVKDMFSGFEVIKSFNIEDKIQDEYKISNYRVENSKYKYLLLSAFVDGLSEIGGFLMFFTAMGLGTYFVIKGELTVGAMIATVQLMNNIVGPLVAVSTRLNKVKAVKLIGEKLVKFVGENQNRDSGIDKLSFERGITFENVNFCYSEERKALDRVSLNIKKGSKYAIVGGSGSGKSTIIKLFLRYYEDFEGAIKIDGVDNREIKVSDLYKLITVIHQNVFMFDNSIGENITLFKEYGEGDIKRAVKLSGLEELVDRLSGGLDSNVGENGCNLSGGEKQRVAIARALIKNTPILVLDEATSSLDNETAYNIEKSILGIDELTCMVVTHKLVDEVLRMYDGIIVVNNGRVEEIGSFDELTQKKGYFFSLYNVTKEDDK
ncbi:ABC transporter ATP-binding protein/permease [Clostridium estertheticum]|uniref:ABC transporter ATP-binding protein n=1 Tax=Clostridium estertheticum TaxID=238834 RepID=UPI0013EE94B7|nr:ABC transporter ATP-binding protein [Clostridium estertheticum]MBZ9607344.1 ABC transporter ATP-binding protein/permease [Clostridium estertheticum]